MLVTTSALSAYVYHRAEQRIDKDAGLLMELQLAQLIEHMDATPGAIGEWREFAERQASSGDPELRLGVEYFDPDGRLLVSAGIASMLNIPLPKRVLMGRSDPGPREVDAGWSYPYLALSGRGEQGIAQVVIYSRPFARSAATIRDAFWTAAPVMLLVTALLGYLLSRGSLRPIAAIARSARRISTRRLDEQIPTTGSGDELDQLATTLNEMLDRIREGVDARARLLGGRRAPAPHAAQRDAGRDRRDAREASARPRSTAAFSATCINRSSRSRIPSTRSCGLPSPRVGSTPTTRYASRSIPCWRTWSTSSPSSPRSATSKCI